MRHTAASADEVGPGAFFTQLGVCGAGGNALHHPGHILPQVAEGLGALGIKLHFAGAHAVYHVPVEGADERLLVVGDVLVQAVQRGAGAAAAGHDHRGTGLIGQFGAGRVIEAVQQGAEGAVRPSKIGGAANHNAINGIELVVYVVVELILHAAAPGFEALAAADAPLHRSGANLHNLRFHPCGVHGRSHHAQSLECVTICIRTTIDEKSFHISQSSTPGDVPQVNNAQTKRSIDPVGARVI